MFWLHLTGVIVVTLIALWVVIPLAVGNCVAMYYHHKYDQIRKHTDLVQKSVDYIQTINKNN